MSPSPSNFDPSKQYAAGVHLVLAEAVRRHSRDPKARAGARYLEEHFEADILGWYSATIGLLAALGTFLDQYAEFLCLMDGKVVDVHLDEAGAVARIDAGDKTPKDVIDGWLDQWSVGVMSQLMEEDGE